MAKLASFSKHHDRIRQSSLHSHLYNNFNLQQQINRTRYLIESIS